MPRQREWSDAEVREALARTGGNITAAARCLMTQHRRPCAPSTICGYLNRDPELRAFQLKCREVLVDFAETHLLRRIEMGDMSAIRFVLTTMGRDRGWNQRTELAGVPGQPLAVDLSGSIDRLIALVDQQAAVLEADATR
jgi:hypothetical protein